MTALKYLDTFFKALLLPLAVYSLIGWMLETIWCSLLEKRFVKRGFLSGPFCPIYGIGALIIIHVISHFKHSPPLLYLVSVLLLSLWEYAVGALLEAVTGLKYWDYSQRRFNIRGRIVLSHSLTWGLLALVLLYLIDPLVSALLSGLGPAALMASGLALLLFFTADFAHSLVFALRARGVLAKLEGLNAQIRELLAEAPELSSELLHELKGRREEAASRIRSYLSSRLRRYPHLRSKKYEHSFSQMFGSLSEKIQEIKEEISEKRGK